MNENILEFNKIFKYEKAIEKNNIINIRVLNVIIILKIVINFYFLEIVNMKHLKENV